MLMLCLTLWVIGPKDFWRIKAIILMYCSSGTMVYEEREINRVICTFSHQLNKFREQLEALVLRIDLFFVFWRNGNNALKEWIIHSVQVVGHPLSLYKHFEGMSERTFSIGSIGIVQHLEQFMDNAIKKLFETFQARQSYCGVVSSLRPISPDWGQRPQDTELVVRRTRFLLHIVESETIACQ